MPGAFGLADDHCHTRVSRDLIAEANARLDVWMLSRCGALTEGVTTELAIEGTEGTVGKAHPGRTADVCREGPNMTIDGTRVVLAWDTPMPGVDRPWWSCPVCGRRRRYVYLRATIACARCHRLQNASRHLRRQTPGVGRVERLRRKLGGCDTRPFGPLPTRIRRGRSRRYHDRLVAAIQAEEAALLEHLGGVVRDLRRRIEVRKARHRW